ncbi:PIN-like domain-containing protein [Saccharicrinis aurantiacus]|uniref:PIN-like domain-containing protein n=1 Tax=Saccharicrinis aurantiacus TaxID=1849719 RepID=UPI002491AAD9|nr:PIN-like domain-containing protein [Saccharicrinis aurantiacus]
MKKSFIEYHIGEHEENIYNNALIVLDTNSLLNLYRYSKDPRAKYLEILSHVNDRLFLTHQIGAEFYKNRHALITDRSSFKSNLKKFIDKQHDFLLNSIESSAECSSLRILRHEEDLRKEIENDIIDVRTKISARIDKFMDDVDINYIYRDDPILKEITDLYSDKITAELSLDDKKAIFKEGDERFLNKIPPGYKDEKKPSPFKYGDLIIWKELMRLASEKKTDILFISDDRKEDWVIELNGKDLGARKELIKEFYSETGQLFSSITTKSFIQMMSDKFHVDATDDLKNETDQIKIDLINKERSEPYHTTKYKNRLSNFLLDNKYKNSLGDLGRALNINDSTFNESQEVISQLKNSLSEVLKYRSLKDLQLNNELKDSLNDAFEYKKLRDVLLENELKISEDRK